MEPAQTPAELAVSTELEQGLQAGIDSILQRLSVEELAGLGQAIERTRSVPMLYDRRVLAACRTSLGRDLTMDEKKTMRALLLAVLKR